MTPSDGAVLRGDINTYVEEASAVDGLFIGHNVLPPLPVDLKDGRYPKFKVAETDLLRGQSTLRAPTGSYNRVSREYTMEQYGCVDRGLEELVDDASAKDVSRFFDAEVNAAKLVLRSMRIDHEIRVAAAIQDTGTFTATAALVAYTQANLTNGTLNPVGDILNAIQRLTDLGVVPNTIVSSSRVFTRIRQSTIMQNYIRGNRPSDATILLKPNDVAAAFELDNYFVGRLPKNTAKKGQAASLSSVWSDSYIWVGRVEGGDFSTGGAGRTLVWNAEGGLFVSESYRDEARRSNVVRVRQNTDEKIVDPLAGQLITTSYA